MSNWIGPTVKQLRNYAMHVLHNFLGFNTNTTAFCLGRSSLHLLLLKSSMADPNHYWWNERTALLRLKQRILTMGGQDHCTASLIVTGLGLTEQEKRCYFDVLKLLNPSQSNWWLVVQWSFPPCKGECCLVEASKTLLLKGAHDQWPRH